MPTKENTPKEKHIIEASDNSEEESDEKSNYPEDDEEESNDELDTPTAGRPVESVVKSPVSPTAGSTALAAQAKAKDAAVSDSNTSETAALNANTPAQQQPVSVTKAAENK